MNDAAWISVFLVVVVTINVFGAGTSPKSHAMFKRYGRLKR